MTPDEQARLDDLTARARTGDRHAQGELFGAVRPLLVRIAQREIGRSANAKLDADDIAADVVVRLVELWRQGRGPMNSPVAYLARAIRNRVIDLHRTPSSKRDVGAEEFDLLVDQHVQVDADDEQRLVDIDDDLALVRLAMSRLSAKQQTILTAVAVDGMKPREIAAATGSNTVSASASRAKKALAVEIRRILLEQEGVDACRAHREALAADRPYPSAAAEHLRTCTRCQKALARFAALGSILAFVPMAVLTGLVGDVAAASAAGSDSGGNSDAARTSMSRTGGARALRPAGIAAIVAGALALIVAAVLALVPFGSDDAPAVASPAESPVAPAPIPSAPTPSAVPGDDGFDGPVSLVITLDEQPGATDVGIVLSLAEDAEVQRVDVTLPVTMRIADAEGWDCDIAAGGGTCTPRGQDTTTLTAQVVAVDGDQAVGTATVEAVVVADGIEASASSTGELTIG